MAQFVYLDEDFSDGARVSALRLVAIDALSAPAARMLRKSDEEQLRFSTDERRLLLTHNGRDFARIHGEWMRKGEHHGGICIVVREHWFGPAEIARRVLLMADTFREMGTGDQLLFLANFS